ncbi:SGNH hydrolase-type esterase domain-containing protein [Gammaproteobacteria bacterium]
MNLDFLAKVISFSGYDPEHYANTGTLGPNDPAFDKRVLCEGDSWFSIGAIPSSNLLFPLRFSKSTLLVNLAKPGDTIKNMSSICSNPTLHQLISEEEFSTKWDAIFISGGGNDLIDLASQIICTPSNGAGKHMLDYINGIELANLRLLVQQGFIRIAKLREGGKNFQTPIVTHVYDYPTPRNAKAKFLGLNVRGPWIYPALKQNQVPEEFWISLTDYMFETLATSIVELSYKIDNFYVVSGTRETLISARLGSTGEDGDWLNEIHPTPGGYKKLADVISAEFYNILK